MFILFFVESDLTLDITKNQSILINVLSIIMVIELKLDLFMQGITIQRFLLIFFENKNHTKKK